jgi:fibronectin-binding autotransporter adhesin
MASRNQIARGDFLMLVRSPLQYGCLLVLFIASSGTIEAAIKYWDINGPNPDAGGASPNGTWDAGISSNWTLNSLGTAVPTTWSAGDAAIFAAGTGATGAYTVTVTGTQALTDLVVQEGTITQAGGTLNFGATPDAIINIASGATWIKNVQGTFTGTGGLVKTGAGTLDFQSKTNNFLKSGTGNQAYLSILQGTVAFGDERELGAVPATSNATALTMDGGTLRLDATFISTYTLASTRGVFIGPSGGTFDVVNPLTLSFPATASATAALSGTGTITKTGAGRLSLNRTQTTFTGKYVVNGGSLAFSTDGVLGAVPSLPQGDYFTLNGGGLITSANTGPTLNATRGITLGPNGGYLAGRIEGFTYDGIIAGTQGGTLRITLNDAISTDTIGGIRLRGANTYDGPTQIDPGARLTISILANGGINSSLGRSSNAAANLVFNGGTLDFTSSTAMSTDRSFTLTTAGGTISHLSSAPVSFTSTNPIAMSGTGARTLTLRGTNSLDNFLALAIPDQDVNPTTLAKVDTGTWVLGNTANSYSGNTAISGGRLKLGASGVIPDASLVTTSSSTSRLDLNGFNETVRSLSGTAGQILLGSGTLTVANPNGESFSGIISGSGKVVKAGAGMLILGGLNTYLGDTIVQAGTLRLTTASLTDTADVYLTSGATLNLTSGATDTIDSLFINGALQAPGWWGAIGSNAVHQTPMITGTGLLNVLNGTNLPGDYNGNGAVDAADYVLWRNGGPLLNEVVDSGSVTSGDYTAWRARFGNTSAGTGVEITPSSAIPEPPHPASLIVVAVMLATTRDARGLAFRRGRC